jgi:hypothetical protein
VNCIETKGGKTETSLAEDEWQKREKILLIYEPKSVFWKIWLEA